MASVQSPAEQRFRLSNIPWETYVKFSDELGTCHVRVTFDRGEMEFMTLSPETEHRKSMLARLVEALTEELDIDIASFGSMTCRREDMDRGLEGDECYWIANEPKVRGRMDIDLEVDPPPDLALEIDVSRSTLNRMEIYAGRTKVGSHLKTCLGYDQRDARRDRQSLAASAWICFAGRPLSAYP